MIRGKAVKLLALLAALGLFAAACGSDAADEVVDAAGDAADEVEEAAEEVVDEAEEAMEDDEEGTEEAASGDLPGAGKTANMGRANWSTGYVHAQILHDLMEEIGYDVGSPEDLEFAPDLGYQTMARGEMDFWANSWYPGHLSWWEGDLPDGTTVGDNLERVEGSGMPAAGLQGLLVTKAWADEAGVTSLDQINDDEALWGVLDTDGNGKGEFFGCPEDWTCDDIMASNIAFAGWDNLEQTQAGYDAMFAEFLSKVNAGEPAIMYTWAPTQYLAQAIPGENVMWLSMAEDSILDDSNPLDKEGGESYSQVNADGSKGFSNLSADVCTQGPDGCNTGWVGADIEITANKEWLADNPAAAALFEVFNPPIIDVAILDQQRAAGDGSQADVERLSTEWIAENRDLADEWIGAAMAAG